MNDDIIKNFRAELKALLKNYNAEIYSEMDGDTHGVTDAIVIEIENKEIMRFDNPTCISHYDI